MAEFGPSEEKRIEQRDGSQETLITTLEHSNNNSTDTLPRNEDCSSHASNERCRRCSKLISDEERKKIVPFHSRLLKDKNSVVKPWLLDPPDPREKWLWILPVLGLVIGNAIGAWVIYDGYTSVVNHTYCPIYEDTFQNGLDMTVWDAEMQLSDPMYVSLSQFC